MSAGILYVVATPIGNLDDISSRALDILRSVHLIAAEDTRHSGKLLSRYSISTQLVALHEHNEANKSQGLLQKLLAGENIALISDAGTPLISDPGFRLVKLALENNVKVSPLPGASAVTAALSVSGLPTDRFVFEGFLPARPAARRALLQKLRKQSRTQVFFESSHRIVDSLRDLQAEFGGDRPASVCRELTKQFETVLCGDLASIADTVAGDQNQRKGEFVIVVGGHDQPEDDRVRHGVELAAVLLEHLPASQAAKLAARMSGASRREIYNRILEDDSV